MTFSPQKFFCNACGLELCVRWTALMGREFKVCSVECIRVMQLRQAASTLGKPAPTATVVSATRTERATPTGSDGT